MRFTTKKMIAVTLAAAMSAGLVPGNMGVVKYSSATVQKQSTLEQAASRKGISTEEFAGDGETTAVEKPVVQFSKESGTYNEEFNLELSYDADAGATIYYTTDGSDPADTDNENRILYTTDGIEVKDRKDDPNVLAAIDPILFDSVNVKISKDRKSFESTIEPPTDEAVDKCTVIKAAAQLEDGTCSAVTTNTYFVGEMADHIEGIRESVEAAGMDLSVMSISMDADDLFDSTKGIYVKGDLFDQSLTEYLEENGNLPSYDPDNNICRKTLDANYKQKGKDWERNTHIDYFESNGEKTTCELQQDCGIRIQGNYSRSEYQKSFRLYARDEYGKKNFKYGFWDNAKDDEGNTIEKYKKIVLRNGGNCAFNTKFADAYWQSLMEEIACDTQHARPCVVYLNGEYWGVYILQDDFCGAYMENKHGIDKDNILIYKGDAEALDLGYKLDEGELPEGVTDESYYFREIEDFMSNHDDLSQEEDFDAFCELVDKDSVLDYFATEVWINNKWDWPGKNWSMWRCTDEAIDPANPYADGKWRFLIYDVEFGGIQGSGEAGDNTVKNGDLLATGTAEEGSPNYDKPNVRCFALLMTNKEFRDAFNARLESFSEGMFEQEHALSEAEKYGKIYEPILGQFFDRFPTENSIYSAKNGLQSIENFVKRRANTIPTITKWVRKQFGDADPNATPTVAPTVKPSATPQPSTAPQNTATPTDINPPLPPSQRDQEIPLGDGSVKILHVNYIATEVLYTAYRVEGVTYRLKSDGTFSYMAKNAEKLTKKKSVVIADEVVAGGKRYKVTEIEEGALQGLKKLQKVTIGENVKTIGKNAFKNCKKLKQLVISGTKLKKIGKDAFQGTAKKLKVSCPKKKKKAYQKLIKKSGLKAKAIQIKNLSFKQSSRQAANDSQQESTKVENIGKVQNDAVKKIAKGAAETITMSSLRKEDGSYTEAKSGDVVTIDSAEELKMLSEYTRAKKRTKAVTFRQIADIDGSDMTMHSIGEVSYEVVTETYGDGESWDWYETGEEQFRGTYDGGGKKLSNINIVVTPHDEKPAPNYYLGLFSRIDSATIQNVDLRSIRFLDQESGEAFEAGDEEAMYMAGIVGYAEGESLISACSNYAEITAKADRAYASGICGSTDELEIQDCHNYGKITAQGAEEGYAVGVSRYADLSTSGCSNEGDVYAFGREESEACGIFHASFGNISDCANTGTVVSESETDSASSIAAGISISFEGQIKRCINSGDISAKQAGGIVYKLNYNDSVCDCRNSGKISGTQDAGGISALVYHAAISCVSNTGEVLAEKRAGGIASMVFMSSIANAENFGKITSGNAAGGAAGLAIEVEFVNIWNHGEISADVSAGGVVGSAAAKDAPEWNDYDDYVYYDPENMEPCVFMNCVHLGNLTGGEHKGTILAYSDKKNEFKHCYVSEESTDPVNASDSSITAKKVSAENQPQADFIDELNQNLSELNTVNALLMKYDAESGIIKWIPAIILSLSMDDEESGETAQIQDDLVLQLKDTAGGDYIDMEARSNGYLAEAVPGRTYEIYRLMPGGSRRLIESDITLAENDSAYYCSSYFYVFRAYTDVKGEIKQIVDEDGDEWSYIDIQEKTLYYKQYYQDAGEVSFPPDPTREGYDFAGWYSDPSACDENLYAARKAEEIRDFRYEYEDYISWWYEDDWYSSRYDSAEEYAETMMERWYGYRTPEEFEQHYDEYYEDSYRVTELLMEDDWEDDDWRNRYFYLRASTVYAKWTKKSVSPSPTDLPQATTKPSDDTAYPILKNLQQYKDKLGNYVQKKGVIYKVNPKKKTASVVAVSSKMVTAVTIQPAVKSDSVTYKVTAIDKKAFTGCKQLKKIKVKGKNLKKVHKKALQGAAKKIKISASKKIKKLF